ncbi:succinylglutamate desuccinylase/aspartoacylase domain-containing protein [Oleisolibacter albus]|uniref:succinylglutamate desuccinylase/aspartoacylase domain-containing protein n=1 Tax=Oleisolibacter albus TaxID=2171757 RepID=UPI000DF2718E|nr:succinylglutamate desuccinylase/aspartoacylase family protein [Oleisolibacter albus]
MHARTIDMPLPHGRPGTRRSLRVHRFGTAGAGPKVYIQAGLHAGEIPGMLVAQHLRHRLEALPDSDLRGELVLVPAANPIGLDQVVLGAGVGRFDLAAGSNFNRAFADLSAPVAAAVRDRLGADPVANTALIRAAIAEAAAALPAASELEALRRLLLGLAADADLMLDLHCDSEAVPHLYTTHSLWPGFADLAARLGCRAALLAEESGGDPFDEACSGLWWRLRQRLGGGHPIPDACAATTIELRGLADVDDAQAAADADAILAHLAVRGVLAGPVPAAPASVCAATPLAGVDRVQAPAAGIIAFHVPLGASVQPGALVAELVDPVSGERHPCRARSAGIVWSRRLERFASAGDTLLSIAGTEPLAAPGQPLLTAR